MCQIFLESSYSARDARHPSDQRQYFWLQYLPVIYGLIFCNYCRRCSVTWRLGGVHNHGGETLNCIHNS
ncbi:hypothetical protein BDZ94DRAFT_1247370 [Collybia nuda]|uniref:Uncharacterized protein n=1 Tax=Collybia nuda TaxID=64659 RepID=A0A9P6CPN5_9AGAR|nr:hypothetical protein BDZ94DRAFT_1247370 [Collybia nuda]